MSRRHLSLSLDLDNLWSYMKTHGDPRWQAFPSYLDTVVPRFLGLLDRFSMKIMAARRLSDLYVSSLSRRSERTL